MHKNKGVNTSRPNKGFGETLAEAVKNRNAC